MKKVSALLVLVLTLNLSGIQVYAQSSPDHWRTELDCVNAVDFRFYQPQLLRPQALVAGEWEETLATPECHDMTLPEGAYGGRGFIRAPAGTVLIHGRDGTIRRKECGNLVFSRRPLANAALTSALQQRAEVTAPAGPDINRMISDAVANALANNPNALSQATASANAEAGRRKGMSPWIKWPLIIGGLALGAWGAKEAWDHFHDEEEEAGPIDICNVVSVGAGPVNVAPGCTVGIGR
jgi:hypothetical protein